MVLSGHAHLLWWIGIVLMAWLVTRQLRTSKSTRFLLPAIVQVSVVLLLSGVSFYIAGILLVFLVIFTGSDMLSGAAFLVVLVGGIIGSILLACCRVKKDEERPNQAPLPTPVSVTPAAGAPVAPATGAAEL